MQDRSLDLRSRGGVVFNESTHSYWNELGERYTSPSSILKKYKSGFNAEETARYKAIREVFGEDVYNKLKKLYKSWDRVHLAYDEICKKRPEYKDKLEEVKLKYISQWSKAGEVAVTNGSKVHDERERSVISNGTIFKGVEYEWSDNCVLDLDVRQSRVYTEVMVWDHLYKVAGLGDKFIVDSGYCHVLDYKTNKEIKKDGFGGKMMKYELSNYPDASFYHYSVQLRIYMKLFCKLTGLKEGECWIISTANEAYGRSEDEWIRCEDIDVTLVLENAWK